ncbi:MAG: aspartate kinase [Cyanobacteria bacterium PR.3.49]|nr:aspartate kinase [Cyanobacteria bacterium PR.3.49]
MSIKVLKFGGSSVKNIGRIEHVADVIAGYKPDPVVVVVSAMGDTTDHLLNLARQCSTAPDQRELDLLLSTGEQVSIVLLSLILKAKGLSAKSLTGQQAGISTTDEHGSARILDIDAEQIRKELEQHDVVVVAGFQGVTESGQITTLGRGGSDTTAVALAAALGASECDIYTDVDGVFTADPNSIKEAIPLKEIGYAQCVTLARNGAQVIHPRAVELGEQYDVVVRVRNTFNPSNPGTEIKGESEVERVKQFCGVAVDANQGSILIKKLKQANNLLREVTECLNECGALVDNIKQVNSSDSAFYGSLQICFQYKDRERAESAISLLNQENPYVSICADLDLCKVTLVGSDAQGNAKASIRAIGILEESGIEVKSIRTSDLAISCLVNKVDAQIAARLIHEAFQLSADFGATKTEELSLIA